MSRQEINDTRLAHSRLSGECQFKGGEVSLSFPVGATLGDVAAWVEGIMRLQDSAPIAIDITMATATARTRLRVVA